MRLYRGLLGEIIVMALDILRLKKLRSALTVLGVVVGITAIVGMRRLSVASIPSRSWDTSS